MQMLLMGEDVMDDNRCVSKEFWKELQEGGALYSFWGMVSDKHNRLQLRFRGNAKPYETITIYYNNHIVWKISKQKRSYKVEVSANHAKGEDKACLLRNLADKSLCFNIQSKNAQRYPFVNRTVFDDFFVHETYRLMIDAINKFFGEDSDEDKYREKRRQQEIFEALTDSENGLYAYDLEFAQSYGSKKEKKVYSKQNEPDVLAVRYENGEPSALVLIEVKSTRIACKDEKSGIIKHIEGMYKYMKGPYMQNRKQEAHDIINAYKELKLHNPPSTVPEVDKIKTYEMMMILTDEAAKYYKEEIREEIQAEIKEKQLNCPIYEWSTDADLSLLD